MILCHCTVVSDGDIDAAIADGARTLRQVQCATGAGRACGGCMFAVRAHLSARLEPTLRDGDEVIVDAAV